MSVLSIRRNDTRNAPTPSPERAALAQHIAIRDTAKARLAELRTTVDRGAENVRRAVATRDDAARAVEQAPDADARAAVASLTNGTPAPAPTLAPARVALQTADDALTLARHAHDTVQREIAEMEQKSPWYDERVASAAAAVLRVEAAPAALALISEIETLHKQVCDKGLALSLLVQKGIVIATGPDATPGVLELECRHANMALDWPLARTPNASPTAATWRAALTALTTDPAAPVPR